MSGSRKTTQECVRVRVLFFGAAREDVGHDEVEMSLTAPATGASAFAEVTARYPQLSRFGRSLLFAINCEYAAADQPVKDGDELAFFPPVSGGSGMAENEDHERAVPHPHDFFELRSEPIDVGE